MKPLKMLKKQFTNKLDCLNNYKTRCILCVLLFACLNVKAQIELKSEYSDVVEVPNTTKEELYKRALTFIVYEYRSANNVIQYKDAKDGVVIGKGVFLYDAPPFKVGTFYSGSIYHTLKIECKDGKYRYTISGIYHESFRSGYNLNIYGKGLRKNDAREFTIKNIGRLKYDMRVYMSDSEASKEEW